MRFVYWPGVVKVDFPQHIIDAKLSAVPCIRSGVVKVDLLHFLTVCGPTLTMTQFCALLTVLFCGDCETLA